MAVYGNTNFSALQGQRALTNVTNNLTTTYQRLSSGLRINSAKDDAAGLQNSDRLTSQINGLNQANRNASDGIAVLQTIDGAAEEIVNAMQRIRTIAVQAANGTNTTADREALNKEASALLTSAMSIATDTTFAGAKIMMGYYPADPNRLFEDSKSGNFTSRPGILNLQVGANSGDTIRATIENFFAADIAARVKAPGSKDTIEDASAGSLVTVKGNNSVDGMTIDITTAEKAAGAIIGMDGIIQELDKRRASIGAYINRLEASIRNQSNVSANSADARSRIRDADFAQESANLSQQSIIQQAAATMLMQANTRPQLGLSLLG